jgi:hypothetical protein
MKHILLNDTAYNNYCTVDIARSAYEGIIFCCIIPAQYTRYDGFAGHEYSSPYIYVVAY